MISAAVIAASACEFSARVQRESVDDVVKSEINLQSSSRFPLKVNRCWSGVVPPLTCILLLMLSIVSDFSTSNVIVLPISVFTHIVK